MHSHKEANFDKMFEKFLLYLLDYSTSPISEFEMDIVKNAFIKMKIKKRQYFLKQGDVCKYFAFITKGAMRQYIFDDKGVEHIIQLGIENWWMGDRESWIKLLPATYCIDAWEDSELLLITRADTIKLMQTIPAFNKMVRQMDDQNNIAAQKRIISSISFDAEKRYFELIEKYPDLLKRFPQHVIASYLGITKETLSRVRKQAFQK